MSRKTTVDYEADRKARLRFNLRNPAFQAAWNSNRSLKALADCPDLQMPVDLGHFTELGRFEDKWEVPCLLPHLKKLSGLTLSYKTAKRFEKVLLEDVKSDRLYGDLPAKLTRKVYQAARERGFKVPRLHARKAQFQIQVFDLHIIEKRSFTFITKHTGEKLSTVKMAYQAALRHIVGAKQARILFTYGTAFARHALRCPKFQVDNALCFTCRRILDRQNRQWLGVGAKTVDANLIDKRTGYDHLLAEGNTDMRSPS